MDKLTKLVGFLLLGLMLRRADLSLLGEELASTKVGYLGLAFVLSLGVIVLKGVRWKLMVRLQGFSYSLWRLIVSYFSGLFVGIATPGRMGELSKVLYVRRDTGITVGRSLASALIDRFFDVYVLVVVGAAACYRFVSPAFLALVIVLIAGPLLLLSPRIGRYFGRRLLGKAVRRGFVELLESGSEEFFAGLERLLTFRIVWSVLLTVLSNALFFYAGYLLALALGVEIDFLAVALILGLAGLFSLMPITVLGVGTRDAVCVFGFYAVGLGFETALAFSALSLTIFHILDGLVGFGAFIYDRPPVQLQDNIG